jgi:alpha 1,2-mannosyltransferase
MKENGVIYGDSESYQLMCRYNSGFIFRHPLLLDFDYYWRIEPFVDYFCKLNFDPFLIMQQERRKYSFVIALTEFLNTIPTLWETTLEYVRETQHVGGHLDVFKNDDGGYNLCHYWSNFEVRALVNPVWIAMVEKVTL